MAVRIKLIPTTRKGWLALGSTLGVLIVLYVFFTILGRLYPENQLLSGGYFVDLLFRGIVLGSVYALIALGYTMVYGIIQLINFAHGEIYMLGAYVGYFFLRLFIDKLYLGAGVPLWVSFFLAMSIAMVVCAVAGVIMEKFAYLPLRNSTRIAVLITAVGMSLFLQNLGLIAFTPNPRSFAPNTFAVYSVQVAASDKFTSPREMKIQQDTNAQASSRGDVYVRIKARSQAGESEWSAPVFLGADSPSSIGEFADYPTESEAGIPAPAGIVLKRELSSDKLEISWAEIPKVFRDIKPIFGEMPVFIPLDFGIGADRSESGEGRRFGVHVAGIHILILATTIAMLAALWWLINRTDFGLAMRAVSFDKETTRLMGIDTDRVISLTFALGSALAAVAGCLVGLYLIRIDPLMGFLPGIKAFVAAVVGGIGSIPGAAAGAMIMGVSETLVKGYIPAKISPLSDAVAFAFLIIVLLVKPTGLFGRAIKEKV
ncbi:branched-chain amino acid ABC transporter permease [bacterium]|nr:branched-chain amino acid ABC transporter permease [bacterium]